VLHNLVFSKQTPGAKTPYYHRGSRATCHVSIVGLGKMSLLCPWSPRLIVSLIRFKSLLIVVFRVATTFSKHQARQVISNPVVPRSTWL